MGCGTDQQTEGQTDGRTDRRTDRKTDRRMDGQTETDTLTDGQADAYRSAENKHIDIRTEKIGHGFIEIFCVKLYFPACNVDLNITYFVVNFLLVERV